MTYLFKLAQRTARLRALPLIGLGLALAGCDGDHLTNTTEPEATPSQTPTALFSVGFRGGIPFGTYALPTSWFGDTYNGAVRNIGPGELLSELAAIKARGGRVLIAMAGNENNFQDSNNHFNMSMWKDRLDRFRSVNFQSYIDDGTVMGNYLIDEPNDPANWGGSPIPGQTLEAMAAYSKQIWPKMATVIRVEPKYLAQFGNIYHNLDAAWAQWVSRRGDPADYIREQVNTAQNLGIMLVTGLNITKGASGLTPLSASTVLSAGSALLATSYPCGFISWDFDQDYLSRSDIRNAMATLSQKAEAHTSRSCSRSGSTGGGGNPPPPPPPLPGVNGIALQAVRVVVSGDQIARLTWKGAAGSSVRLFVDGALRRITANDGRGRVTLHQSGKYVFKICEVGSSRCSNQASVTAN